jgi:hypothetical protein
MILAMVFCVLASRELGFHSETMKKGDIEVFQEATTPQYFRILGPGHASLAVSGDTPHIHLNETTFYHSPHPPFTLWAEDNDIQFDYLMLPPGLETEWSIALSADRFVNTSYLFNESQWLSFIFYQPDASYRLLVECSSPNLADMCEIYDVMSLDRGIPVERCLVNETCDIVLEDGFYVLAHRGGIAPENVSVRVFTIKGSALSGTDCDAQKVGNSTGQFNPWFRELQYACEPPNESVLVAVVLILCLMVVLGSAILTYYQCRPNREAYESNEEVKSKGRTRLADAPFARGESDGGYNARSELMMNFCD